MHTGGDHLPNEYFQPRKRIAHQPNQPAATTGDLPDQKHTVTAFYQHLSDKKPTHVNQIEQLTSIIRP